MAKKNKKKKNNSGGGNSNNSAQKKQVLNLTEQAIAKVEELNTIEKLNEVPAEELIETNEDAQRITEIKETGNVDNYINMLRDRLQRVNALERKAKELRDANAEAQKEIADKKKELEDKEKEVKAELDKRNKELNIREKKLDEERLAIDNGEYSTVIQSLLETLRKTEEDITSSTRQLVEELGHKHESYISSMSLLQEEQDKLAAQQLEIKKQQHELERERKRLESQKAIFERKAKQELEDEYRDQIDDLKDNNERLDAENKRLIERVGTLEDYKRRVASLFETASIDEILGKQETLKAKCKSLQDEVQQLPSLAEYNDKLDFINELQKKIQELENNVSEQRLSELRLSLHNADAYILEINTYKAKIDSAEARERSLLRTIEDLHETIQQLKDEEKVKEAAFEQARRMDNDTELQDRRLRPRNPSSLKMLVEYLQAFMARKKTEPFFYERKIIKIFLAGLHMSPLSILQGISGTGKTSLPREIAKALVAAGEGYVGSDDAGNRYEPYRICAIQSGWRDNMDLIGFYNNFEKKYKETDFFKAIYLAAQPKYKDTLFFIILDEMNLSHPEHYFADFLSLMEQSVADRYVKINADEELLPKLINERQMHLPPNVRFIGTANHDETTLDFAPKTYDRSNVITLATNDEEFVRMEADKATQEKFAISYSWLVDQFVEAENKFAKYYELFNKFLSNSKFKEALGERGIGIGNRFDKQAKKFICAYMAMSPENNESLAEAADHLITSRLFRSLKNRYDLTQDNLREFKNFYVDLFKKSFSNMPKDGIHLLDNEIENKK